MFLKIKSISWLKYKAKTIGDLIKKGLIKQSLSCLILIAYRYFKNINQRYHCAFQVVNVDKRNGLNQLTVKNLKLFGFNIG